MTFEQRYVFHFEAAHELGSTVASKDHPYAHIHGHSFQVTLFVRGEKLSDKGWLTDFAKLRAEGERLRDMLDHRFLNHIEGLEVPTLEHIAQFIFEKAKPNLPLLSAVELARPSLGESVRYENTTTA
ncbi:MAG: 6-carboxytetrahydropterin synthase [Pseudomonadota bacterium]